ncbi:MAG: acyl-CoA desaturase, partial [Phycisphaerales bacterium]
HVFATLGALCWQGGPLHWVGTHRLHHAESDSELDPHSPQHGFTWSHILWCFHQRPDGRDPFEVTKDLARDPYLVWLDRWFLLPQVGLAAVLYGIGYWATGTGMGALGYVIWGVCVRTIFCYHATWFVNSAAHTWGYRNFRTTDGSRNTWWVALLSFGEGWHNNHHAQQRSAAHGMRWWEVDPTWWTIRALERMGLVHSVVRPKLDKLDPHR